MDIRMHKGFTLIELLVAVAIVGILTTIAVPAYNQYVQRGKVAEATSTLASMRVQLEQYFQDNRQYAAAGCIVPADAKYFGYVCAFPDTTHYSITASGVAGQGMNGYTYTINQDNAKTSTLPDGSAGATCWISKSGETC